MDSPESQSDSPVTGQPDNDDRSDTEHDRPAHRSDKREDDRFDAEDDRRRSGGDNQDRSNARGRSELTSEKTKPETNSAKIRKILKRTDSFDDAIKYPASKRQAESPVIVTTKPEMVTPDELFGPASPHWSDNKMSDRRQSDEQGRRPKTRAQNSRLHASRKSSNDTGTPKFPDTYDGYSSPERKTYDEGKAKNYESKTPRRKSSANLGESPMRSVSRFESISRHEADYDSSRTSDSNSRDDNKTSPTSRRHSRPGDTDTPATNRLYGSNTARIERDNHRLYDARTDKRYVPRYSPLSNRSSYNHGDIVDENLMISNPKLDITLLKLFAQCNARSSSSNRFLADGQADFISMEPVMWRVHPMDAVHRETLDREMTYIADNISPRDVVGELYRQHVLTHTDHNQLSRIENQGDRAVSRLMVKTLQRRGASAYPAFLEVLRDRGYPDVRERLLESEQSLKLGIKADKHGLKNYLLTPRTGDRSTERTNDYTGLPVYPTLSSNPTIPATPLMMTTGQITPLFHNPYTYQMPVTFQMTSPTYPMMANQGTNFGGVRTPTPLDQIQFNQIERNLDDMRDELRALHEEMRDIKSNIKKGKQSPVTLLSHNSGSDVTTRRKYSEPELVTSPKHHNTEPYYRRHPTPTEQDQPTNHKSPDVRFSQSDHRYPTHPRSSDTGNTSPDAQKEYKVIEAQVLDRHLKDLHNEVKALHDDVTALSTARSLKAANDPGVTYINQPDSQREAQARKLEKQLDDLHAQLRALRDDVTDLKSENNKRPSAVGAKTETPGSKAKGTPQYLSPQQYSSSVPPTRPVTRGANSDKENQPNSKPVEQSTHKPEGQRVRWSRDDIVYPIPKSDGGRKDSIRAFTPNGTRITEPSRILSPPSYNPRRGSKIMSPLTIFTDPSLPWPESARMKVKS